MKVFGKLRKGASIRVRFDGKPLLLVKIIDLKQGATIGLEAPPALQLDVEQGPPPPRPEKRKPA